MPAPVGAPAYASASASAPAPAPASAAVAGRFRPRLTVQTLTRGDGLPGLRAIDGFGPRGAQLAVARVAWTYTSDNGLRWDTPAPRRVLNARPRPTELLHDASGQPLRLKRDLAAEADARDALWSTGLHPLPAQALQWRTPEVGEGHADLWSLPEEPQFGDFWAEQVPRLQALGWSIVVQPGFAHPSVAVDRWRLVIDPVSFDEIGRELAEPLGPRVQALEALRQPPREGSFLLSLGTEVDGKMLDLAPLLADLLKRDARWLKAHEIAAIDDAALIVLHAPGGRRIEAPAAPLKAIIGAMLDLLTDPRRKDGPLQLSTWEAQRLEALRMGLADTHEARAARAGPHGAWQLQGAAGLAALAQRLRTAGSPPRVDAPIGLGLELRPCQLQGVAWLQYLRAQHLAGILADDMGLGKTAQVLAHLLIEKLAGRLDRPALVVLPTSLISNWQAEAARARRPCACSPFKARSVRKTSPASRNTTWCSPPTRCSGATSTPCARSPGTC